ncbi:GPI biosynthesis protein family Pig-F-domain-containing protein [Phyllosticta citrichinensis]|uniref:GPI biosynthesis protein family Pig-F-domain-containing protein n=1 Tax=Phyllosticta citrichinensis TaxID=1130410 RepID=A0ABR1XJP8_9PEZI
MSQQPQTIFTRIEEPAAKPAAPAAAAPPSSKPIEPLSTDLARIYTQLHPVLLLSLYALQFKAIVADPVGALASALLPLAALQVLYAAICLPAAGSSAASPSKAAAGRRKKDGKGEKGFGGRITTAILALTLATIAGIPLLSVLLVLFGAPATSHLLHTALAAAHIAYLASVPLIHACGVDGAKWRALASLTVPADEVFGAAVGAVVGAWAGAVPIPLDWDREWQKWPVTIVCGAYAGYAVGKVLGGSLLKGKTFRFD